MTVFKVIGKITLGKEERGFARQIEAESENAAKHKTYALFGSKNGVKRNKVIIERVEKVE